MFRVIIGGRRDYNNYAQLERAMDRLLSNITDEIVIVCGMARGADTLGEQYGKQRGYRINYFPADWKLSVSLLVISVIKKWQRTQMRLLLFGMGKAVEQPV